MLSLFGPGKSRRGAMRTEEAAGKTSGISVVVPAYNAAGEISSTIERIRNELAPLDERLEFIVVDDGSTDRTAALAALSGADVRCLRSSRNRGKGWAVYRGVRAARFGTVCFTDADGPFLFGSYRAVVERALRGGSLVIGSRRLSASQMLVKMEVLNYAARRHLVGLAFNRLLRQLLRLPIYDTQCGLKAFAREVGVQLVERIRSFGYLFDVELLLAARSLGIPVEEVAVSVAYRERKTSLRLMRESASMGLGLLWIALQDRRGLYASPNPELPLLESAEERAVEELTLAGDASPAESRGALPG